MILIEKMYGKDAEINRTDSSGVEVRFEFRFWRSAEKIKQLISETLPIIVDDEAHCLHTLQAQILWTELPIRVINTFDNVCDVNGFKSSTPDFIFLDVKMPVQMALSFRA
jgi:hypothetical protein